MQQSKKARYKVILRGQPYDSEGIQVSKEEVELIIKAKEEGTSVRVNQAYVDGQSVQIILEDTPQWEDPPNIWS